MRFVYGGTPADFTQTRSGRIAPGQSGAAWTARDGGTQLTDLLIRLTGISPAVGQASSVVVSDDFGAVLFAAPDGYDGAIWLDFGAGPRVLVRPVTLPRPKITSVSATAGPTAAATITGDEVTGYQLAWVIPAVADGSVNTAKLADGAVTSAKIADGTIVDADIASAAAIAPSKVAGTAVTHTRNISTGAGLTGGGALSTDRTIAIADGGVGTTQIANGAVTDAKIAAVAVAKVTGAGTAATKDAPASGNATAAQVVLGNDTRLTQAIPSTLVDAKGDLLVGTGPDTLARIPVGPDGSMLMADSSAPVWATVLPRRNASAGQFVIPGETFGTQAGGNGYFFGSPVLVGAPMSIDALSVMVTGAPASGRSTTMAVYRLTPTGWSLVAGTSVAGTILSGFTGAFTLTLPSAVRLASGIYCAVVGGSLASITLAAVTQNSLMAGLVSRATVDMATARGGGLFTTGTGQPATLALAEWPAAPAVGMRVA